METFLDFSYLSNFSQFRSKTEDLRKFIKLYDNVRKEAVNKFQSKEYFFNKLRIV